MRVGVERALLAVLWAGGCTPSLEAMSAGHVGCVESEIEISDESDGMGSKSWVATCNGVRHVCSQVVVSQPVLTEPSAPVTQVNCTSERTTAEPAKAAEQEAKTARGDSDGRKRAGAPAGAAGFRFGQTREEAEQACAAAGFEVSAVEPRGLRCSGLPEDVGLPASAELAFCARNVCGITLRTDPRKAGKARMAAFVSLADALGEKYGVPVERTSNVPGDCRDGPALDPCLDEGRASARQSWRWAAQGKTLSLTLDKAEGADAAELRIVYTEAPGAVRAKADAL
jgi:hypothetical protein